MPIFIKTEKFKNKTLKLSHDERKKFISMHKEWVEDLSNSGHCIYSGYLINEKKMPGSGGLLIIEAKDYLTAQKILENDPMIKNKLVTWELQEWVIINGSKQQFYNHLG